MGLLRGIDLNKSTTPYRSWIKIYGWTVYTSLRNFGHQSVWGFLDLGLMAACLACSFSLCDTLLYRQGEVGERQGMSRRCPGGLWVKTESEERAYSTAKPERCWADLGRDTPRGSGKEISSGAQGPSSACHNPENYTKLVGEEQPGRAEEKGGILS